MVWGGRECCFLHLENERWNGLASEDEQGRVVGERLSSINEFFDALWLKEKRNVGFLAAAQHKAAIILEGEWFRWPEESGENAAAHIGQLHHAPHRRIARGDLSEIEELRRDGQHRGGIADLDRDAPSSGQLGGAGLHLEVKAVGYRIFVVAVGVDDVSGPLAIRSVVLLESRELAVLRPAQRSVGQRVEIAFESAQRNAHAFSPCNLDCDTLTLGWNAFRFFGLAVRTLGCEENRQRGEEAGSHQAKEANGLEKGEANPIFGLWAEFSGARWRPPSSQSHRWRSGRNHLAPCFRVLAS